MLTIIESESSVWMITSIDDQLHVYTRAGEGEWGELSLSEDPEEVDPEKSFMLEELFSREVEGEEDGEGEPEGEEEESDDDDGPELEQGDETDDGEEEAPEEEEEKPRRRRAAASKS